MRKNEKNKKSKNEKNGKNEKMKKNENDEKREKNEEILIQTQNPLRFPRFTVVVVTFFVKILDDFHDFVSECVSFPRKINNPFWVVSVFFRRRVTIVIGRETKTHILPTKINEIKIANASPSNNNYFFRRI